MTDQEINAAIAEACGWKFGDYQDAFSFQDGSPHFVKRWLNSDGHPHHHPPDYCNDLNAMHEAEETLSYLDLKAYRQQLMHWPCTPENFWRATARERAEAFLRTIGKWRTS